MSGKIRFTYLLFALFMAGCEMKLPLQSTPAATAELIRIQISPALRPWQAQLHSCVIENPGIGVQIKEISSDAMSLDDADILFYLGNYVPQDTFAADLGSAELLVITNSEIPETNLTANDLHEIYTGKLTQWPSAENMPIEVWGYAEGDDLRQSFENALGGISSDDQIVHIAPDPSGLLQSVQQNPGAIGYLTSEWVLSNVNVQSLSKDTPILGVTSSQPTGISQSLLSCLQQISQDE